MPAFRYCPSLGVAAYWRTSIGRSFFNHKHNEENGEDNRDGRDDNRSWNCGLSAACCETFTTNTGAAPQGADIATLI
jgi:hypothetical protein